MKFLMIVLAVHFIAEMIGTKIKENTGDESEVYDSILHPAEFNMR